MKLDRLTGLCAVGFFALALSACGAKQEAKAPAPIPANAVGSTQLMAADIQLNEPAAKVGKSQHDVITDEAVEEDPITAKDQPRRKDHSPHTRGSGFSGWK
jgi:hypothetical protein